MNEQEARDDLARAIYPLAFDSPIEDRVTKILRGDAYRIADSVLAAGYRKHPGPPPTPQFRFSGRATGSDPEGYYFPRWDWATPLSVVAATKSEATEKALTLLGMHPRFGRSGFGDRRDTPGWAIKWDSIDEEGQG